MLSLHLLQADSFNKKYDLSHTSQVVLEVSHMLQEGT